MKRSAYTWKVAETQFGQDLETILNRLEQEGWEVFHIGQRGGERQPAALVVARQRGGNTPAHPGKEG